MKLARVRIRGVAPFADVTLPFVDEGVPRPLTVVFGGDRTGKTTLLLAIASTRPGLAAPPPPNRRSGDAPPSVLCDYVIDAEDRERPHLLRVCSPAAVLEGETADETAFRRKEQALFDRRAVEQGGFACVAVSGARWFSRTPNLLTQPDRTVGRFDVRAPPVGDDATRADLTRETKQILAYATLGATLAATRRIGVTASDGRADPPAGERLTLFERALTEALAVVLEPFGRRWVGIAPDTFEPLFAEGEGRLVAFEDLPRGARHLAAIVALAVRAIYGAGGTGPLRDRECLALVDDVDAGQDPALLREIPTLLRRALPGAQWVLATSASAVTASCAAGEVLALRLSDRAVVEAQAGVVLH